MIKVERTVCNKFVRVTFVDSGHQLIVPIYEWAYAISHSTEFAKSEPKLIK